MMTEDDFFVCVWTQNIIQQNCEMIKGNEWDVTNIDSEQYWGWKWWQVLMFYNVQKVQRVSYPYLCKLFYEQTDLRR